MPLFQLGAVTIDTPGPFSADGVDRDFGGDHAVKPVVGAMQPREFVGPADKHLTLVGTLVPYFWARQGQAGGLGAIDMLEAMADSGEPQLLVRGDGVNLGWWLIEKGSLRATHLSKVGVGQVAGYSLSLVKSTFAGSAESAVKTMNAIIKPILLFT